MDNKGTKKNAIKILFCLIWLGILAYLIYIMTEICSLNYTNTVDDDESEKPVESSQSCDTDKDEASEDPVESSKSSNPGPTSTGNPGPTSTEQFDYTENFEAIDTSDIANSAAPTGGVKSSPDSPDEGLTVEGTDALIAASSERFYSVDTKGQTNRNASNDLRGDLPVAYNEKYTPFNQSAIYGEPLVPAGRL